MGISSFITMMLEKAGDPARVRVNLHLDERAHIAFYPGKSDHPWLDIDHGDVNVTITVADPPQITATDVQNARRLSTAAQAYLDEIQQRHAAQNDQADPSQVPAA